MTRPPPAAPTRIVENLVAEKIRLASLFDGETDLSGARFADCQFTNCDMKGLLLTEASFERCDFSGSDLRGVEATGSRWNEVRALKAVFSGAELADARFGNCNLSNA